MNFKLESNFKPTGDQPKAINELVSGLNNSFPYQTLLGVTGSGKTFTVANVIKEIGRPTLVLSHNKTLAAQLFSEFKSFFPNNSVEYFVSYYDYYQPEAYIPSTGIYIEKDLSINEEIEKYRLKATSSLLSGRKDIIVVSSVSCIYGMGNPDDYYNGIIFLNQNLKMDRQILIKSLVNAFYSRTTESLERGTFRAIGNNVDVYPSYSDIVFRIKFDENKIAGIESYTSKEFKFLEKHDNIRICPTNLFMTSSNKVNDAIFDMQKDLLRRTEYLKQDFRNIEAKRLEERTNLDIEMIKELGYCSGIENYSRYFDGRKPGARPFCLLDYFPENYLTIIDESHVTIPQIRGMYGGDRSRKENLVEHGFRLPSALDNRPLKFEEFDQISKQTIFVSATPSDYELNKSNGIVTEQIIRPTGLLDPIIEIRPIKNQIDDLIEEIRLRVEKNEKSLVTTLTKKMAEELSKYLGRFNINCSYLHSDIDTIERVEILNSLVEEKIDVIVGVNLLREGLDLPEVSLVAIIDADKEGFLRSHRSLTQTAGRAARNLNGRVIMYADKITDSMKKTIDETNRRRKLQEEFNEKNQITPTQITRKKKNTIVKKIDKKSYEKNPLNLSQSEIKKEIKIKKLEMNKLAKELDFDGAIRVREEIKSLQKELKS
ncbi:MAG: excinuclease ABC subunit UvrB [Flavobacteriales bacterium TMED84]|nr:MAG: excinuclease ABC subunit UvrB [Flavobacteriales bacterium TMED84]